MKIPSFYMTHCAENVLESYAWKLNLNEYVVIIIKIYVYIIITNDVHAPDKFLKMFLNFYSS